MRITLVIFSLRAGGAERVMATLANHWAERGETVTLLTLNSGKEPPFYALNRAVCHCALDIAEKSHGAAHAVVSNVRRVRILRRAIRESRPDTVISLMSETNVLTLLATAGIRVPVVVQEQNNPFHEKIGRFWEVLRNFTYPRATRVVVLNQESLRYFPERVQRRGKIIPNFTVVTGAARTPFSKNGSPKILAAMGRFEPQKGFDMLLQAFAKIAPKHPEWTLEIWGDGPLRGELERLASSLGIDARVRMPGKTKAPFEQLKNADIFVMSSRYEGFPLSLCEAMACGLPAISFDCPTGPREIIREGVDGVLVPPADVDALSTAMDRLMTDETTRETFASKAAEVRERFGQQKVVRQWDELLAEVTMGKKPAQVSNGDRIKILFLIRSLGHGGAERQLIELVKRLDRSEFEVTVATFYDGGLLRPEIEKLEKVRVVSLGKRSRWDAIRPLRRLSRLVREIRPDIIHGYMGIANELALLMGKIFGIRVVWGMRMSQMDKSREEWLSAASFRVSAWLSRFPDLMIANSYVGQTDYIREGYSATCMKVVSNGIDIKRFCPDQDARRRIRDEIGVTDEEVLVGIVGRFAPQKDHPTFLRAAAIVSIQLPNARFLCVGDGPAVYRKELERLACDCGVGERIIWIAASSDMPGVYNAMDVMTLPSAYGEGFPNVIGEAMACGVPVVATAVGDSAMIVENPSQVVPPRNPGALAEVIVRTLTLPPGERAALGLSNRDRIVREFSMEHLTARTTAMLEEVL